MTNTVEVDLGIVTIFVESDDADLEAVEGTASEKLEEVEPLIEDLKRMDFELQEEFSDEERVVPDDDPSRTFG